MNNLPNNSIGQPLRIHELDVEKITLYLNSKNILTTQGKKLQPLHEMHLEIIRDPARFKVLAMGRRAGKTLISVLIAFAVLMQPSRRVWIVGPDFSLCEKLFRELYHIFVNQLKIIIPGKEGRARNQRGDYYLELPWGSVLEGKSLENPDSLAGEANDLVIVDEAGLNSNIDNIWTQMIRPTLMDKEGSAIFISTPRGKNGFYKLFLNGQLGKRQREGKATIDLNEETGIENDFRDWSSFQKTSYDNPLLASTPEKAKQEIDSAYREAILAGKITKFKQEYLADFEATSDTVFPEFVTEESDIHPLINLSDYDWHPDMGPIFAACDHNMAKPASTIFAQLDASNNIVIFDEAFTPNTTSFMQGQQILEKELKLNLKAATIWNKEAKPISQKRKIKFEKVIADISGNQIQLNGRAAWDDIEASYGFRPVGLRQDRETGCNMIKLWLQYPQFDEKGRVILGDNKEQKTYPKLFINRNCINLIYALSTAVFKKSKNGSLKNDYEESPEGYEGLLDSLRYLLVYLFHDKGNHISVLQGVL